MGAQTEVAIVEIRKFYQVHAVLQGGTRTAFIQVFTTPEKAEEWAQKLQTPLTLTCGKKIGCIVFQSYEVVTLEVIE
jgi:phosphoribosylamine-glycine ligase